MPEEHHTKILGPQGNTFTPYKSLVQPAALQAQLVLLIQSPLSSYVIPALSTFRYWSPLSS